MFPDVKRRRHYPAHRSVLRINSLVSLQPFELLRWKAQQKYKVLLLYSLHSLSAACFKMLPKKSLAGSMVEWNALPSSVGLTTKKLKKDSSGCVTFAILPDLILDLMYVLEEATSPSPAVLFSLWTAFQEQHCSLLCFAPVGSESFCTVQQEGGNNTNIKMSTFHFAPELQDFNTIAILLISH